MREATFLDTKRFWDDVVIAAVEVFDVDGADARRLVDSLAREIADWPSGEQLLFYHQAPLYVAAEALGREVDDALTERYLASVRDSAAPVAG